MTRQLGAILLLLAGFLANPTIRQDSSRPGASTPTVSPRKLALLIGINKYKYSDPKNGFYNLHGCINDIHRMRNLLIGKFGFKSDDVKLLPDDQATHQGILNAIQSFLRDQAKSGDIVVIHFSGHGSQASDPSKINQLDETIVPYDSRDPQGKVSDITGDELATYVSELSAKTKFVTVILDSCHSGDLIGKGLRMGQARSIPPDTRKHPQNIPQNARAIEGFRRPNATFAFVAAARSDETAKEYTVQGSTYGALTYFFTQEVSPSGGQQTYQDVIGAIATDVSSRYPDQHVTLAGINKDGAIFADTSILSQPFVETTASNHAMVTLQAGTAQGVTRGSVYDIYPPQTKSFGSATPITSATITAVNSFDAAASLTKNVSIQNSSRAVEKIHKYPDQKLKIFLQSPENSQILQSIKAKLSSESNLDVSTTPAGCQFRVADEQGKVVIYAADAKKILSSINKTSSTQQDLLNDIGLWVKWYNLLSITNDQPGVQLKVRVLQDHPAASSDDGGVTVHPGDKFRLSFENPSGQSLYLAVLNLGDNGRVKTVYQSNSPLPPTGKFTTYEFQASLPANRSSTTDILKIFATDQPVDFSFLNQEATVGSQKGLRPKGAKSPLGQLLAQAGLGYHRDLDAVPSDWVTTSVTITTRPAESSKPDPQ
jgi:hypothetical protein